MSRLCRLVPLALAVACAAGSAACSRDSEVLAAVKEVDAFSTALVNTVTEAPSPAQGVAAAQSYLDQNRARIQERLRSVKQVRGFQISAETRKTLEASFTSNAAAVAGLQLRYVSQAATDPGFRSKLEKLVNDYQSVLTD